MEFSSLVTFGRHTKGRLACKLRFGQHNIIMGEWELLEENELNLQNVENSIDALTAIVIQSAIAKRVYNCVQLCTTLSIRILLASFHKQWFPNFQCSNDSRSSNLGINNGRGTMVVQQCGSYFQINTPAKLNFHLEILARRADGFHEIDTLMLPVSIYDTLSFSPTLSATIELQCQWAAGCIANEPTVFGELPPAHENLVWKALHALQLAAGVSKGGTMQVWKRIPAQAGLGGASSNAAAALLLANTAWKLEWSLEKLSKLAATLGSDVPFFLTHNPAICRGRGEVIVPVAALPALPVVVVRPPEGLSTPQVYKRCRVPANPQTSEAVVIALRSGSFAKLPQVMHNRLQAPAEEMSLPLVTLKKEFEQTACWASQMSGSGSSYFGICRSWKQAQHLARTLRSRNLGWVTSAWAGGTL
jgi:4-diphosphocytidyl-2-C-methyl-D-erythritol kinase